MEKAINSVLKQTYTNIELIVIDDNDSTSKHRKENRELLQKYSNLRNVRYIENEENVGGAVSRNKGIELARGKYIAFLDDDDEFCNDKLELQLDKLLSNNCDLVYCHCRGIDINNNTIWINKNRYRDNPLYESMIKCVANTSLWLCKREVMIEIGGFEDVPAKQDLITMIKLLGEGYKIDYVDKVLVNYLIHEDKISSDKPTERAFIGYNGLRNVSRGYYSKLSQEQIKNVEYILARTILLQAIGLKKKGTVKYELFNMLKSKPFYKGNIGIIFRIIKG